MLTVGQMPETLDEWYNAIPEEQKAWNKAATPAMRLGLASAMSTGNTERLKAEFRAANPTASQLEIDVKVMAARYGQGFTDWAAPKLTDYQERTTAKSGSERN